MWGSRLFLTLVLVAGCRSTRSPSTSPDTLTSSSAPVEINAPSATEIIDEMGDPAPELDKRLVIAQVSDASTIEAILTGLPGATPTGVTQICAVNLDTNSAPDCFTPSSSDGSFHHALRNTRAKDRVALWGEGPKYLPGGVGINEITEMVQYWSQRFPGYAKSVYPNDPFGRDLRAMQGVDDGLFIGAYDGLYFIRNSELSLDPEAIFPEKFSIASGLPSSDILSLTRDRDNLWIGTVNGVARMSLDTHEIEETYLPGKIVEQLVSDGDRHVWIASDSELIRLTLGSNGPTIETFRHDPGDPTSFPGYTTCLTIDSAGGLWFGSSAGLSSAPSSGSPVRFQTFTMADGLPSNYIVSCAAATGETGVWVGGLGYVTRVVPESGSLRVATETFGGRNVETMTSMADGTVWAGTLYPNVSTSSYFYYHVALDGSRLRYTGYQIEQHNYMSGIEAIWLSPKGDHFIATSDKLCRVSFDLIFPAPVETVFVSERSLPDNHVQGIVPLSSSNPESSKGLWILTKSRYSSFMDLSKEPEEVTQFDLNTFLGVGYHYPTRIAPSLNGRNWVLYRSPVASYAFGNLCEFELVDHVVRALHCLYPVDGVPDGIEHILEDGAGGLWLGTTGNGLHRLTMQNGNPLFRQVVGSIGGIVTSLTHDGLNGIYAGTTRGLSHIQGGAGGFMVTSYSSINSALPYDRVMSVASDGSGGAWIVTKSTYATEVLSHLVGPSGEFSDPSLWDGLLQGTPGKLLSDGRGGVWVGTNNGLDHLRAVGSSFDASHFGGAEGIPDLNIQTLNFFPMGGLVVGTKNGFIIAPYW